MELQFDTSQFDAAMAEYIPTTERDLAEIVNKRALNVAFRAMRLTPKADRYRIAAEVGEIGRVLRVTKKGRLMRTSKRIYATRKGHSAPLAALIINKRRERAGLPGLQGKEMEAAIKRMVGARQRSAGFHKSGFIQPVRRLALATRNPVRVPFSEARQVGKPKGSAIPAVKSISPTATIIAEAGQALKIAGPAMQQALNDEATEMREHVARKLQQTANKYNASTI
jgi:hypothetical protein